MRLISTVRAPDGTTLGRDVMVGRADRIPLLRAGVTLTPRYRDLLLQAGVSAVYIHDEASEGIDVEPLIDDATRAVATAAVSRTFESARDTLEKGETLDPRRLGELEGVVARILEQIETSGNAVVALADLSSADAYTFQHSIDVTAVGLLVGHRYFSTRGWVDYQGTARYDEVESRLCTLGVGLLLHDIGKLAVPLGILNKPGKLNDEEWEIMKAHPRAGLDMLPTNRWSPLVRSVVLRHHERWNGSGYPDGKAREEIHQMARIAAVADVYDAITSDRPYAPARAASIGVRVIAEGSGTLFDPEVVDAFRQVVAPFPAGTDVRLNDGREALVVAPAGPWLDRPVVRILEHGRPAGEVSLMHEPSLGIEGWDVPGADTDAEPEPAAA